MAERLAAGFAARGVELLVPVQTNQVFARLSAAHAAVLRAQGAQFYDWPALGAEARRFVCAFDTAPADVDALIFALPH
jgi:threonine aldolase